MIEMIHMMELEINGDKMKFIKLLSIFLIFFAFTSFAYAGNIEHDSFFERNTNNPLNNVRALVYVCTDDNCNQVDLTNGRFDENSGSTNKIDIEFLGTINPTRYAEYFYRSGYLPLETTVRDWGTGNEFSYNNDFRKLDYCSSHIDNFYVINEVRPNEPLEIDVQASLGAETYSAFTRPNLRPFFIPPDQSIKDEFYSAETEVKLKIINEQGRTVFEDTKLLNIYLDTKKSLKFTWTPTEAGRYRAVVTSTVTDNKCNQDNDIPQQAAKEFSVLEEQSNLSCYTLLNEMTFSDPHPIEDQGIKIFVAKISNFRDQNEVLHPVATETHLRILKDGNLVYETTKILPQNPNADQSVDYSYDWTTAKKGLYNIVIDGEAEDQRCNGLTNTPDHIETNLLVKERGIEENPPENTTLEILSINNLSVYENTDILFNVNVKYNGNNALIYNIDKLPEGASFNNNVFSWTPDYNTVKHDSIINTISNIIGLPLKKEFEIEFKVTDGTLLDTNKVKITVIDKNRNPILKNINDIEVKEGQLVKLDSIKAEDPDNDNVKLKFSVPLNKNGEWQTKLGDEGNYKARVIAEDGFNGTAYKDLTIKVLKYINPNQPPVFDNIGDKTIKAGDALKLVINAKDYDNDTLHYTALIDNRATGATFDEDSHEFYWNTRIGQEGNYNVEFFVSDGLHIVSQKIKIYVVSEEVKDLEDSEIHKFSVSSLVIENTEVRPGNYLDVYVRVRNYGTIDDKITLRLSIKELGIRETKTFDLAKQSGKLKIFSIKLPNDSPKGNYIIEANAFNRFWHSIKHIEFDIV